MIDHAALRYWRDYYLFTREELAADVGVSVWSVQAWELGERCPSMENFRSLIHALGIPAESLMLEGYRYREPDPEEDEHG